MSHTRKRHPTGPARTARAPVDKPGRGEPETQAELEDRTGLERLIFFSDAVFAIAITLLVIDIHLPSLGAGATAGQVTASLKNLMPNIFGFVVSFIVIGGFWSTHHRTFRYVRRYDAPFIWMNIFFLMSIAFLPFSSSLLSEHGNLTPAVVFYSVSLAVTSFFFLLLWVYATHHRRLVDRKLSQRTIQENYLRLSIPLAIFILSVPAAAITTHVEIFWLSIPGISRFIRRYGNDIGLE